MNGFSAMLIRVALASSALVVGAAPAAAQEVVEYIHTDALGSPVAITDASGNVIERTVYEPYGAVVNRPLKDGPGYTGHVTDSGTGLSYMQQRYYDPTLGRFLSSDPMTAFADPTGFFNRYKYAASSPYKYTDPDGRCERVTGSNICGGGAVAKAMLATSARSPLDTGAMPSGGSLSSESSTVQSPSAAHSGGKGQMTSYFTGDKQATFTYAAALGVGFKGEFKKGPDNNRYSIITPALGATAAGTVNLFTASYDFLPSQNLAPADAGLNVGAEVGAIVVLGAGFRYTPPAKFELSINGGLGVSARVEIFEVGLTPGKLP